jgi:SAM-dependent methyltransferase
MSVGAKAKRIATKLAYRSYLLWFGGGAGLFGVSERIVEYPFAVKAALELPNGARVGIFGCHGDLLSTLLPALGYETYGVDIKDFPLSCNNFTFRREDVRRTSFPDSFFDAAIAVSTIEHIGLFDGDDQGDLRAVVEMRRVLKPGGLFVVTVPFASSPKVIPLHERIYDERGLRALLENLDVETISPHATGERDLWAPIELDQVPAPTDNTSCVALVRGRKPS